VLRSSGPLGSARLPPESSGELRRGVNLKERIKSGRFVEDQSLTTMVLLQLLQPSSSLTLSSLPRLRSSLSCRRTISRRTNPGRASLHGVAGSNRCALTTAVVKNLQASDGSKQLPDEAPSSASRRERERVSLQPCLSVKRLGGLDRRRRLRRPSYVALAPTNPQGGQLVSPRTDEPSVERDRFASCWERTPRSCRRSVPGFRRIVRDRCAAPRNETNDDRAVLSRAHPSARCVLALTRQSILRYVRRFVSAPQLLPLLHPLLLNPPCYHRQNARQSRRRFGRQRPICHRTDRDKHSNRDEPPPPACCLFTARGLRPFAPFDGPCAPPLLDS
jgi:hypothetical protein